MSADRERTTRYPGIYGYETRRGTTRYLFRVRDREGRSIKRRGFTSVTRAREARSEVEASIRQGTYTSVAKGRVTVAECWEHYLAAKKTRLKPSSINSLEVSWRTHVMPRWARVPVAQVSRRSAQLWVTELAAERSPSVVIRAAEVLRGALAVAVEDKRISVNPAARLELPRKPKGKSGAARRYLSRAEVRAVAEECRNQRDRVLFLTLALVGLRWGEAIALRARFVDVHRRKLYVEHSATYVSGAWHETKPKAWEIREVPLPRHLAVEYQALLEEIGPTDLVFPSPWDPTSFRALPRYVADDAPGRPQWLQAALSRAGVDYLSPHDLRHTAASLGVQSGASVKLVQRMLGHESAAMTLDVYSDLFESDIDDVADRMDVAWRALDDDAPP